MVPLVEVERFINTRLLASAPTYDLYQDKLPDGVSEGLVYRNAGGPPATFTEHGTTLMEEMVYDIKYVGIGEDSGIAEEAADLIKTALEDARGATDNGEVFGCRRELPIRFSESLKSGQKWIHLGWKFRFYARGSV